MSIGVVLGLFLTIWIYVVFAVEINQFIWLLLNILDSFSAIRAYRSGTTRNDAALRGPIKVWIVWLALTTIDSYTFPLLAWIPFYNLHRSVLSGFILFSRTTASGFIYETMIHPQLSPWQHHIDLFLSFSSTAFELVAHFLVVVPGQWVLPRVFTSDMETVIHQISDSGLTARRLLFDPSNAIPCQQNRRIRRAARYNHGYCHDRPMLDPFNPFYVGEGARHRPEIVQQLVVEPSHRRGHTLEAEVRIPSVEHESTPIGGSPQWVDQGSNVTPRLVRGRTLIYEEKILWAPRKAALPSDLYAYG